MTLLTEYRKRLLELARSSVNRRAERIKLSNAKIRKNQTDEDEKYEQLPASDAAYAFEHWHRYNQLSQKDPATYPSRQPPALCIDGPVMHQIRVHHALAIARRSGHKQVSVQLYYDACLLMIRRCCANGCRVVVLCFDKATPRIKLAETQKRDSARKRPKDDGDGVAVLLPSKRQRVGEEEANGGGNIPGEEEEDITFQNQQQQQQQQQQEAPGVIPTNQYRDYVYNPLAEVQFTFRRGRLIKYKHNDDGSTVILNESELIDPGAIIGSRRLRAEFTTWMNKTIAIQESKVWKNTTFCLDFRKDKPPLRYRNGAVVPAENTQAPFTTGHWYESDQALGMWAAALMRGGQDVVMWSVDGDMILICNWVVFAYRYETGHLKQLHRRRCSRITASTAAAAAAINPFQRDLATEERKAGLFYEPEQASFSPRGSEPYLTLVLHGRLIENKLMPDRPTGGTEVLDMNLFCSEMSNRFWTPNHLCILSLLLKNDYVEKKQISDHVGYATLAAQMNRFNPTDAGSAELRHKWTNDALWIVSRTWAGRRQISADGITTQRPFSQSEKCAMINYAIRHGMHINGIDPVLPSIGPRCVQALYRWRRCAVLSSDEIVSGFMLSAFHDLPKSPKEIPVSSSTAAAAAAAVAAAESKASDAREALAAETITQNYATDVDLAVASELELD